MSTEKPSPSLSDFVDLTGALLLYGASTMLAFDVLLFRVPEIMGTVEGGANVGLLREQVVTLCECLGMFALFYLGSEIVEKQWLLTKEHFARKRQENSDD